MKIDKDHLYKIAHLARLEFDDSTAAEMIADMNKIISWVEKLEHVDTNGVEPLTTMSHEINALREDEVKNHLSHERALKNAPKRDADFFRVPKVIE
ncbi:MAG: Asp-tRNA(Asn)/Glu-tRNA(Gln) amidotransferase subunit GatC [Bacteroidota bacterium]